MSLLTGLKYIVKLILVTFSTRTRELSKNYIYIYIYDTDNAIVFFFNLSLTSSLLLDLNYGTVALPINKYSINANFLSACYFQILRVTFYSMLLYQMGRDFFDIHYSHAQGNR